MFAAPALPESRVKGEYMSVSGRCADYPRGFHFRRVSFVTLASGFVVLACLSILSMQLSMVWQARAVRLHEAGEAAANVSEAVAQHAYATLKEVDTLLLGLAERGDMLGAAGFDHPPLRACLVSRMAELPQVQAIVVFADDGRPLRFYGTNMPVNLRSSDNEYLYYHRLHNDQRPYIGTAAQRSANAEWIMAVSRRINLPDGSFGGIVLATIRLDYFRKFYEEFSIGEYGTILMKHADARSVLEIPYDGSALEKTALPSSLISESPPPVKIKGTYLSEGGDGKSSIMSYRKITEYPLVVVTTLSQDEALRGWRRNACLQIAALIALIMLVGFLGCRMLVLQSSRVVREEEFKESSDELKVTNQLLAHLASQDGLTGLANRRSFDDALKGEFSRAQRSGNSLGLMMIDVDLFKQYNDIYGHVAGDECLRKIAHVVSTGMRRAGDMAARYGGEEMVLLLPGADVEGTLSLAEAIRQGIENLSIPHSSSPIDKVTVSIGVAVFPLITMDMSANTLVNAADHAMYTAKASGRNNVCTCNRRDKKFSRISAVEINENWCQEYVRQTDLS